MNSPLTTTNPTLHDSAREELEVQRRAIAALGHELRLLVDATVRTMASPQTLHRLADDVRTLTGRLAGPRRQPADIPAVDEFPGGVRMYSPVTGAGSPIAPPMQVTPTENGLTGRCRLGIAQEGPPGYGHGGISAMLLDELMGRACAAIGNPGMTISLMMRYRSPVPLETPLRVLAHVTRTENRKIYIAGTITTDEDPVAVLVEADGIFVAPEPEVARALFPALRSH